MKILGLFAATLLLAVCTSSVFATSTHVSPAEARRWRADLQYFAQQVPQIQKNLSHTPTCEQFPAAVQQLNDNIPQMSRDEIIVALKRIGDCIKHRTSPE